MKTAVEIISNGSKWLGEKPDTVKQLIEVLGEEQWTLDPTFEAYGDFVFEEDGWLHVFGNFHNLSYVFNIRVPIKHRKQLDALVAAIEQHKASERYKAAREVLREYRETPPQISAMCSSPSGHEFGEDDLCIHCATRGHYSGFPSFA